MTKRESNTGSQGAAVDGCLCLSVACIARLSHWAAALIVSFQPVASSVQRAERTVQPFMHCRGAEIVQSTVMSFLTLLKCDGYSQWVLKVHILCHWAGVSILVHLRYWVQGCLKLGCKDWCQSYANLVLIGQFESTAHLYPQKYSFRTSFSHYL